MASILDSRCILIIGSTSGIGRRLALSILDLPSKPTVIMCGRRQVRLDDLIATSSASEGRLKAVRLDVNLERPALKSAIETIAKSYPELDAVMFSSGVQHHFNFTEPETIDLEILEKELNTNYTSIVSMITFFLPHLLKIGKSRPAFIYTITSGLAITPSPLVPDYCATKAALHSLTWWSRNYMTVGRFREDQGTRDMLSKFWMSLDDFTKLTMDGLKTEGQVLILIGQSTLDAFKKFEGGQLKDTQEFMKWLKDQQNSARK